MLTQAHLRKRRAQVAKIKTLRALKDAQPNASLMLSVASASLAIFYGPEAFMKTAGVCLILTVFMNQLQANQKIKQVNEKAINPLKIAAVGFIASSLSTASAAYAISQQGGVSPTSALLLAASIGAYLPASTHDLLDKHCAKSASRPHPAAYPALRLAGAALLFAAGQVGGIAPVIWVGAFNFLNTLINNGNPKDYLSKNAIQAASQAVATAPQRLWRERLCMG